jgi:hypothetical protein
VFEGMTQRYIAKTGVYDYCFVGIWKSAEAIAAQRHQNIQWVMQKLITQ